MTIHVLHSRFLYCTHISIIALTFPLLHSHFHYCTHISFFRVLVINSTVYLQVLYAVFCLLALGWTIGFLPPLDALGVWLMEQVLVRLLGGSAMSTELRYVFICRHGVTHCIVYSVQNRHSMCVSQTVYIPIQTHNLHAVISPMYVCACNSIIYLSRLSYSLLAGCQSCFSFPCAQ